jgi:hypothetical protein
MEFELRARGSRLGNFVEGDAVWTAARVAIGSELNTELATREELATAIVEAARDRFSPAREAP